MFLHNVWLEKELIRLHHQKAKSTGIQFQLVCNTSIMYEEINALWDMLLATSLKLRKRLFKINILSFEEGYSTVHVLWICKMMVMKIKMILKTGCCSLIRKVSPHLRCLWLWSTNYISTSIKDNHQIKLRAHHIFNHWKTKDAFSGVPDLCWLGREQSISTTVTTDGHPTMDIII